MRLLSNSLVSGPKGGSLDFNIFPGVTAPDKPEGLFLPVDNLGKVIFDDATYAPQAGYAPYQVEGIVNIPSMPSTPSGYQAPYPMYVDTEVGKTHYVIRWPASSGEAETFSVYEFNHTSKLWSTRLDKVAYIGTVRSIKSYGVFNDILYCMGGALYTGTDMYSKMHIAIDLSTGLLTTLADAPLVGSWYAQPSRIGNNIYWPGRYVSSSPNYIYSSTMFVYNVTTNLWTTKTISGITKPYICSGKSLNIDDKLWVLPVFGATAAYQTGNAWAPLQDCSFIYDPVSDLITTTGVPWNSGIAQVGSPYSTLLNGPVYFGRKIYYVFSAPNSVSNASATLYGLAMVDVDSKERTILHQRKADNAASLINSIIPSGYNSFLFCDNKALFSCNTRNDGVSYFGYSKIVLQGDTYPAGTIVLWFSNANPHVVIADSDDFKLKTGIRAVLKANAEGYLEFVSGAKYKVLGGSWINV